jgi:hypothetical protein
MADDSHRAAFDMGADVFCARHFFVRAEHHDDAILGVRSDIDADNMIPSIKKEARGKVAMNVGA